MARDVADEEVDVVELGSRSRPGTGGFFAAMVDMVGDGGQVGVVVIDYGCLVRGPTG